MIFIKKVHFLRKKEPPIQISFQVFESKEKEKPKTIFV